MSVLGEVKFPVSWERVRLGAVAYRVSERGFADLDPLSVFLSDGVVPRADRDDNRNQLGEDLGRYQRVLRGDLVFNKLRTWQGGFGVSGHIGIVSPAYIIARPSVRVLPQFLHHYMRSEPVLAELTRLSKWMPPSQFDINWDDIRGVTVALPPLEEQRRIADFLDDQVARIDTIALARDDQQKRVRELLQCEIDAAFEAVSECGMVRAARMIQVLPGFAFPSEQYSANEDDVRLLRGVNVVAGSVCWDDVVYWPTDQVGKVHRFALEPGDLVMGMDRPWIGDGLRIARLTHEDAPSLLLQRVARIVPNCGVDRDFVFWAYRSRHFRNLVEATLTGLSVPHLSGEQILGYPLPALPLEEQRRVATSLRLLDGEVQELLVTLQAAQDRLAQYKRSLITAAVTGELDVTTARRAVPA